MAGDQEGLTPIGQIEQYLLCRLHQMRNHGELCDATIIVEDHQFRCHKVVLAAFSSYFQSLFSSLSGKGVNGTVNVRVEDKRLKASAFAHLLDYLYTGRIRVTKENAADLLHAANCKFFNIKEVQEACSDLLRNSGTMAGNRTVPENSGTTAGNLTVVQISGTLARNCTILQNSATKAGYRTVPENAVTAARNRTVVQNSGTKAGYRTVLQNSGKIVGNRTVVQFTRTVARNRAVGQNSGTMGYRTVQGNAGTSPGNHTVLQNSETMAGNPALLQNPRTLAGHCTVPENSETKAGHHTELQNSGRVAKNRTVPENLGTMVENHTELQNLGTMAGNRTIEAEETDALVSGYDTLTKRTVSNNNSGVVHGKYSIHSGATCKITDEQCGIHEAAHSSRSTPLQVAQVDKKHVKVSACENPCTALIKTFVSKSVQDASSNDNNVSDNGKVKIKEEVEPMKFNPWLQTHDLEKKEADAEIYPSEGNPNEAIAKEEDLNQVLLEELEMELGGIPTIEDLDEDPIVWHPLSSIEDESDCPEGERSEVRSTANSGADCDEKLGEGGRRKRKLSEEMFQGMKRSKRDMQAAAAHTTDGSVQVSPKNGPLIYTHFYSSPPKDKSDVTGLTPVHLGVSDGQSTHKPMAENRDPETLQNPSPAQFYPLVMSEKPLAESITPCDSLVRADPERLTVLSNPIMLFGDFAGTQDTSQQQESVPVNKPTNIKREVKHVPFLPKTQFKTASHPSIVDERRSVLMSFGDRVVARDLGFT
ncbi:ZBTB44 [Branchiostoma lanceolatum]|uniref:ZBTB44 protein n=1 Tax=Branchiostoma lanceolatum TaxID=7740 RepID=A0A8K0EJV4_BRALA|nr:ZBTB44 [Branchiostoma lanceolatum]